MVEVFKTNITEAETANTIVLQIQSIFPSAKINFDLEDCDRILRIEAEFILITEVMKLVAGLGYECEVLP